MKNIKFLFASCIIFTFSSIQFCFGKTKTEVPFFKKETLIHHLEQVNAEWKLKKNLPQSLQQEVYFQSNQQRIQLHLFLVEAYLRRKEISHLSISQKKNRGIYLKKLKEYAERGVFPKNTNHKSSTPYFVDNEGVMCAVGSLVYQSGATGLVDLIHEKSNNKYLKELHEEYNEIENWADENGFTLDELAWIQPVYCPAEYFYDLGNGGGANGQINVMEVNPFEDLLMIGGNFTEVDGVSAKGIIGWEGSHWVTFDEGVDGEIFCMTSHNDKYFIGGKFKLLGDSEFSNVAYWNGMTWVGWKMGDEGIVYALESHDERLYVGGDFQIVNGDSMQNLAYYDEVNSKWSNDGLAIENGEIINVPDVFSVDDVVRDFAVWEDLLYVVGDFRHTSPNISHPNVIQYDVKYLAIWYDYLWLGGEETLHEITKIDTLDGGLFLTGQTADSQPAISGNYNGMWDVNVLSINGETGIINGVFPHGSYEGYSIIFGDFDYTTSKGIKIIYNEWLSPGYYPCVDFNGNVRAGNFFKDNYYFAGDFSGILTSWGTISTELAGITFSNFTSIPQTVIVDNEDVKPIFSKIEVKNLNRDVFVKYENLDHPAQFNIFNINGQELKTITLEKGTQEFSFSMSEIPQGYYFFSIRNEHFQQSGKLLFF